MATIAKITMNGYDSRGFNITETVGGNGSSNRTNNGDVMVVQIMLHLIAYYQWSTPSAQTIGLASLDEVPVPTNVFDEKTRRAILRYQQYYRPALRAVDGVVHPASYRLEALGRQRNIQVGPGLMMITHLHEVLRSGDSPAVSKDYTAFALRKFPRLGPMLELDI
jgi:peptidoglycan hydrolase-like protein with peptidoglycan-binding domain